MCGDTFQYDRRNARAADGRGRRNGVRGRGASTSQQLPLLTGNFKRSFDSRRGAAKRWPMRCVMTQAGAWGPKDRIVLEADTSQDPKHRGQLCYPSRRCQRMVPLLDNSAEDAIGTAYGAFLTEMDLQIISTDDIPTFETQGEARSAVVSST
ncbi:hypothetical protein EVAR_54526_1 [Eumeta japonica]|uniref:Uncharacterized protein n=1 Tax=Eumeta variegata TaxID=151549 RepID=A0A4C1YJI5_EUMVA|nr:hypothetical protein EVAR_54526_1 [Eumeta japonica]